MKEIPKKSANGGSVLVVFLTGRSSPPMAPEDVIIHPSGLWVTMVEGGEVAVEIPTTSIGTLHHMTKTETEDHIKDMEAKRLQDEKNRQDRPGGGGQDA